MLVVSKIRNSFFAYAVIAISACGGWSYIDARKIEILIAIPLSGSHLDYVRKAISEIQEKVEKAAIQNGYELNTSLSLPDSMHITLEQIIDVDEDTLDDYKACVASLVRSNDAFDITDQFKKARFDIIGWAKSWGVLRFPAPESGSLSKLARQLKNCLKKNNLKSGMFPGFKAHISLGKFIKNSKIKLPKIENSGWVPEIKIELPESSFLIQDVVVMTREKIVDAAGKVEYGEGATYHFPLRVRKTQNKKTKTHMIQTIEPTCVVVPQTTESKIDESSKPHAIALRALTPGMKDRFAKLSQERPLRSFKDYRKAILGNDLDRMQADRDVWNAINIFIIDEYAQLGKITNA